MLAEVPTISCVLFNNAHVLNESLGLFISARLIGLVRLRGSYLAHFCLCSHIYKV